GCGTGDALIEAAKVASSGKLCGVDLSEEMLKKAREKLRSFRNASLFNKDILDFSSEEQFDAVVSTEAFHHFVEPERSIKAMAKLLKKGGRLVVGDIHFRPLFLFNFLWKLEPGFVKMYSHGKFRKMFADAGLKVVKQKRVFVVGLMTVGEKS
ncbi:class I SAM-dependent methyltransferase, partial [Candidatus Woesearchaeota archaeon]|nr:class I SAM-dependent methyltransferase [Candidatus Woesearchaeota archaeon]